MGRRQGGDSVGTWRGAEQGWVSLIEIRSGSDLRGSISAPGARRDLFFTIPHPCLFLPLLTKQSGVPSRPV